MCDLSCLKMTLLAWHCHLHVSLEEILLGSPGCTEKGISCSVHCFFWSPPFSAAVKKMEGGRRRREVFSGANPIYMSESKPSSRHN